VPCDDATGHAVVLNEGDVDLVVVLGQERGHLVLGVGRIPVIRVLLADVLEGVGALVDIREPSLDHARAQEVCVGIGRVALDDDVVAGALDLQEGLGLHLADQDVVERDVEHARIFDQAVIGDDWDLCIEGLLDGRL